MSSIKVTSSQSPISRSSRIGIIGAGPAGISVAHFLRREGYSNVTLLESAPHIAGKSSTFYHDNRGYDVGALMVGNNYSLVKSIVAELDCPLEKFYCGALDIDANKLMIENVCHIGIISDSFTKNMSHYLEEKKFFENVTLPDAWALAYTSAGYGYIQDDIPAAYFLKFIQNSENTIWRFKNGFQDFWIKMAK
ncbi:3319_t:CDS:2, partial [Racocetra persica]